MLVNTLRQTHFALENFRGPLEFLYQLVQRQELDIRDIPLQALATQFLEHLTAWEKTDVNAGAEFIGTLASLALVKSRLLLPQQPHETPATEEETEAGLGLLQQLIDYCRLKEAAKNLATREEMQWGTFPRGAPDETYESIPSTGLEQVSLQELHGLLARAIKQADTAPAPILEEVFKVSDKIRWIKNALVQQPHIHVETLFPIGRARRELIATFLAILELLKIGAATLQQEETDGRLVLATRN